MANPPNDLIYDFKGYYESNELSLINRKKSLHDNENSSDKKEDLLAEGTGSSAQRESLSLENTMWANTVLASSGHILGMIVFTGKETRA